MQHSLLVAEFFELYFNYKRFLINILIILEVCEMFISKSNVLFVVIASLSSLCCTCANHVNLFVIFDPFHLILVVYYQPKARML